METLFDLLDGLGLISDAEKEALEPVFETESHIDAVLESFKEKAETLNVRTLHDVGHNFYFNLSDMCAVFNLTDKQIEEFINVEDSDALLTELITFEQGQLSGYDCLCASCARKILAGIDFSTAPPEKYITMGGVRAVLSHIVRLMYMNKDN